MILKELHIKNFKGIKELKVEFDKTTNIHGKNEAGKTTIYDSFNWLLFGKNSDDKKDFSVKPKQEDGEDIHNLETFVEGVFALNGKTVKLKRLMEEKWVKKRGSAVSVFEGNATSYWRNDLPVKAKEFEDLINVMVEQEQFKLLTNPLFFNTKMDWKDRRNLLFSINNDVNIDVNIMSTNKDLVILKEYLLENEYTIDEAKKVVQDKKKMLKKEVEKIPTRIDEIHNSLPDISIINKSKFNLKEIEEKIVSTEKVIADEEIKRDNVSIKSKEYNEISFEISKLENQLKSDLLKNINSKEIELSKNQNAILLLKNAIEDEEQNILKNNAKIKSNEYLIEKLDSRLQQLRAEVISKMNSKFVEPDKANMICPTCKQNLPQDDIEKQIKELEVNFNTNKKEKIENITKVGKEEKAIKESYEENITVLLKQNKESNKKIEEIKENENLKGISLVEIKDEIAELKQQEIDFSSNHEWIELNNKLKTLDKLEFDSIVLDNAKERLKHYKEKETELKIEISKEDQIKTIQDRIADLEKEEKEKNNEIVKLESIEFMVEEFIKIKSDILTSKINSKFEIARFKLFETQINGGVKETCICMVDGVPFDDLNNAAKTQVGLDIIKTLSKHYEFEAPIFIDNREGITDIPDLGNQIVNLIVSKEDEELRIECQNS